MSDEKEYLINQINRLFIQNDLDGSMVHAFFHDCLDGEYVTLRSFYIDDRVPFKGKRNLYKLIEQLQQVIKEEEE